MGGHSTCCVVNCHNNGKNSDCKFYTFPTASHRQQQRNKWIAAVQNVNPGGVNWFPKKHDKICSAHFIGNKKSEEEISPSYVPTIFFPSCETESKIEIGEAALARHNRYMKRRNLGAITTAKNKVDTSEEQLYDDNDNCDVHPINNGKSYVDQGIQVNFYSNDVKLRETFICNRYIDKNSNFHDAECQTEIEVGKITVICNQKNF